MAIRKIWNYVFGHVRYLLQNYNVIERAEKQMKVEKRYVSPRHPGTEIKFQVLIKDSEKHRSEIENSSPELVERMKQMKIKSEDVPEVQSTEQRPLPQVRGFPDLPTYGYEEPEIIPEGKCSLRQVLEFITKHQDSPKEHSIETLAENYKINVNDMENILKYFHVFHLRLERDATSPMDKSALEILGASKIIKSKYRPEFSHLENESVVRDTDPKK